MNSFIENINYVAGLDNRYGSVIELYKNNLSLKSVEHDIELKFSYYSNYDKKIHSIVHSEPGVLVGEINDTLLSFKTLVESSNTGSEFTCTVNFVINNISIVNINIVSNNDMYKTYELEMKVVTAGAVTYDVFGEVKDSLKILPSLAMITASDINVMANVYEIQEDVITVSESIANVETVSDSIANVNTVGTNITNVNTVSTHISNVDTVSQSITNVNTVSSNIVDVGIASANISNINTVANAKNLADIIRVADDLNSLDVNSIADITIVANDLVLGVDSNIITVSGSIDNVNTVANNIVGLNSIVSNMPEILLANDNAAIATTKALESSDSAAASLQSSLDSAASAASAALFQNHIADTTNPHEVTKIQVGLEFAENTADIDKIVASAGKLTSAVNISLSGDASGSVSFDGSGDADIVVSIENDSHIHSDATTSVSGFMSTSDKSKLDAIAPSSNNYVHPSTHDASMITTTDEFSNSDSTNVQDVLDDLDSAIDVEKGRIDAILIGAGANADTFAEVVALANSIDTTNDQAFAGYVLSNDARSATIEGNVTSLTSSKADKSTTYTKSETDAKIIELAPATDIKTINGTSVLGSGDIVTTQTTISGNAGTATKLATARTINGVAFDGTANIIVYDSTKLHKINPEIIGSITEQVYNLTGTEINPANGTMQYKNVSANTTFTETLTAGQSVLLRLVNANSYIITFPTIVWVGATSPVLTANCVIVLWKEQSTLYGSFVGSLV